MTFPIYFYQPKATQWKNVHKNVHLGLTTTLLFLQPLAPTFLWTKPRNRILASTEILALLSLWFRKH
jgi:hypothetical protein